ncbi:MAG TPA: SDR family NAD(P)-dependent oxidoreductase [Pseudonocardiaceae bacterium]|nr:SDR family NAD(P)-dependent oxidoreductase [Pseudonocardiaceae bacterium]
MSVSHAALITGCSSGIARATALRLHAAGLPVYATARHVDDLSDLVAKDVTTLALDLTDAESMDVAVKRISAEHGAVGILVNNAGYAELGTIEEIALDDARVQLEIKRSQTLTPPRCGQPSRLCWRCMAALVTSWRRNSTRSGLLRSATGSARA